MDSIQPLELWRESIFFLSVVLVWCAFKETKGVTVHLELGIWLDGRTLA